MTSSSLLGLALQVVAVVITHQAVSGDWIRRIGALFLLVAFLYHGVTEVIQWMFPGRNPYHEIVGQGARDDWIILVSAAMLLYAITYAAVARTETGQPSTLPAAQIESIKLRWLAAVVIPLASLVAHGRGSTQLRMIDTRSSGATGYLLDGLVLQFAVILVAGATALVIIRFGMKWAAPLFAVQGGFLAFAGARSMVVASTVLALYGAALFGVRLTRRQLVSSVLILATIAFVISSARATVGREKFTENSGFTARVSALSDGIRALPTETSQRAVLNDFVYRFDGNSFGAMVLQAMRDDVRPVGLTTAKNDLLLAVPSFINPNKLATTVEQRNEEAYYDGHFGLPATIDYLPGVFGTFLGYFGPLGLLAMSMLLGCLLAFVDRMVLSGRRGFPTTVFGFGLAQSSLMYEQGPTTYITGMRGVLLLMFMVWLWHRFAPKRQAHQSATYETRIGDQAMRVPANRLHSLDSPTGAESRAMR